MQTTVPLPHKAPVTIRRNEAGDDVIHISLDLNGVVVELTNIGCAITAIRTADKHGVIKNIVAGFRDLQLYKTNKSYFGCVVGRYSNRITDGNFSENGRSYQLSRNEGSNHLHGGFSGFSHKTWELKEIIENEESCGVCFTYFSPDGEEGYPGNLSVSVTYLLDTQNCLSIHYSAQTDKNTPVNLTNHSYFNLTGFEESTILKHYLQVNAQQYTIKSNVNTPTGEIASVRDTAFDFTTAREIGQYIGQLQADKGYDHCLVLDGPAPSTLRKAAVLHEENSGRILTVYTDKPSLQVYTANHWDGSFAGEQGLVYRQHGGIALETQYYPDSPNHPHFPNTILQTGETYSSTTRLEFGLLKH